MKKYMYNRATGIVFSYKKYRTEKSLLITNIQASICLLTILFLLLSCVSPKNESPPPSSSPPSNKLPSVYLNPSEKFPNDKYISAVGSGANINNAQQSALAGISRQISVKIDADETLQEAILEIEGASNAIESQSLTSLSSNTRTQSNEELQGIQFSDTYTTDKNVSYIIAYLDRKSVGKNYVQQIEENSRNINKLLNESSSKVDFERYSLLLQAERLSKINDIKFAQLQVISQPMSQKISRKTSTVEISQALKQTAQSIPLFSEVIVRGAPTDITPVIRQEVVNVFADMSFKINQTYSTSTIPHIVAVVVKWEERKIGNYEGVFWDLNVNVSRNDVTEFSFSVNDEVKALDKESAKTRAIHDIKNAIQSSTRKGILDL